MLKGKKDNIKPQSTNDNLSFKDCQKSVVKYIKSDDYKNALICLKILTEKEDDLIYTLQLGICYFRVNEFENALKELFKVYKILKTPAYKKSTDFEIFLNKTVYHINESYVILKQYQKSIDFSISVESEGKSYKTALEYLVVGYTYLNNTENAKLYFNLLRKKFKSDNSVYYLLFKCYMEKNDLSEMIHYFDKLDSWEYEQEDLYDVIVKLSENHCCCNKIIEYCEKYFNILIEKKTLSTDLTYGEILDDIIVCYFMTDDYEKTIEYFEKLKKHHDSSNKEINYQYLDYLSAFATISYLKLKRYNEITVILNDLLKQGYGYYAIYLLYAVVNYFKKDFNIAIEYCKKITSTTNGMVEFIIMVLMNSKDNNLNKFKENLQQLLKESNLSNTDFVLIIYYSFYFIYKIENNYVECENYLLKIKDYESKINNERLIKKLSEIQFDENYYTDIILICLTAFEL